MKALAAVAFVSCCGPQKPPPDLVCDQRSEAVRCPAAGGDAASVVLPDNVEVCKVTLYGVEPVGPDEQYQAVEAIADPGDYYQDGDTLYMDCPSTGGAWAWRSFVVTYSER
jgi:hypothetical protein